MVFSPNTHRSSCSLFRVIARNNCISSVSCKASQANMFSLQIKFHSHICPFNPTISLVVLYLPSYIPYILRNIFFSGTCYPHTSSQNFTLFPLLKFHFTLLMFSTHILDVLHTHSSSLYQIDSSFTLLTSNVLHEPYLDCKTSFHRS